MCKFNRDKARERCRKEFNEIGIYGGTDIARLIGFGEDESDSYYLLRYPPQAWGEPCKEVYCSMVGGWYSIKKMGKRGYDYTERNCYIPKAIEYTEKDFTRAKIEKTV
jgi:hypothetical protein